MSLKIVILTVAVAASAGIGAQANSTAPQNSTTKPTASPEIPPGVPTPSDYVIGPEDVLLIIFWREKDMSAEVGVRPDGKISLPLINDIQAAGLSPEQLRLQLTEAASKLIEEPTVTVVVKTINSRRVFITGQVAKPGAYPLPDSITVLQLISMAGGVTEYADVKKVRIMRKQDGTVVSLKFNYADVEKGKNLDQNILLKPGDTVIVP